MTRPGHARHRCSGLHFRELQSNLDDPETPIVIGIHSAMRCLVVFCDGKVHAIEPLARRISLDT